MDLNIKIHKWLGVSDSILEDLVIVNRLPDLTVSMDAILKWVVPNPKSGLFAVYQTHIGYWVTIMTSYYTSYQAQHKSLPMAYCMALEKYIDSQEGK